MSPDRSRAGHDVLAGPAEQDTRLVSASLPGSEPTQPMGLDLFSELAGTPGRVARQRDPDNRLDNRLGDRERLGGDADPAAQSPRGPASGRLVTVAVVAAGTGVTGWLVGRAAQSVAGDRMAPWILGRASGICAYLLLVTLVGTGLLLSHPARARWRRPSGAVRIRAHVSLAVFTAAFLVLHVVVLATDRYAHVGWWGALLPLASTYRPLPVTMGVIAMYSGVLAGVTAGFAGRLTARIWWPVHKVAAVCLLLALLHGVLSGADTPALIPLYVVTTAAILLLAGSRYRAAARARRSDPGAELP
jgi:DMSO/TMAO reductase YedYZ heme-binding membrane subunit